MSEQEPATTEVVGLRRTRRRGKKAKPTWQSTVVNAVKSQRFKQALAGLAGVYVLFSLYNWYVDATSYGGVLLGGTQDEALYALGPNPDVTSFSSGVKRLDFPTDRGTMMSVTLSKDGQIDSVRCAIVPGKSGICPAMFHISPGHHESDMYGWLGVPNRRTVKGDVLTADYTGLGVRFELRQFKVVAVTHYAGGDVIGHTARFIRHLLYIPGGVI
jgi:hypothetical protein